MFVILKIIVFGLIGLEFFLIISVPKSWLKGRENSQKEIVIVPTKFNIF